MTLLTLAGEQGYVNKLDNVLFPEFLRKTSNATDVTFLFGDGSGSKVPTIRFTTPLRNVSAGEP